MTKHKPPKPKPPASQQQNTAAGKTNQPTGAEVPKGTAHEPTASDNKWHAEERDNWERQLRPQWALVVISLLAVIAAGITLLVLRSTLDATKEAANAAVAQAKTTDEELKRSHRPWAALAEPPKSVTPLTFDGEGAHIEINYKITNGGTSPAIAAAALSGQFRIRPHGTTQQIMAIVRADPEWNCNPEIASIFSKQLNFGLMLLPQASGNTQPTQLSAQKGGFRVEQKREHIRNYHWLRRLP